MYFQLEKNHIQSSTKIALVPIKQNDLEVGQEIKIDFQGSKQTKTKLKNREGASFQKNDSNF